MNDNPAQGSLRAWLAGKDFEVAGSDRSTGVGYRLTFRHSEVDVAAFSRIDVGSLRSSIELGNFVSIGATMYRIEPSFGEEFLTAVRDSSRIVAFTVTVQSHRKVVCIIAGDSSRLSDAVETYLPSSIGWVSDTLALDSRDFGRKVGHAAKDLAGLEETTMSQEHLEMLERSGEDEAFEAVEKEAVLRIPALEELRAKGDACPTAAFLLISCYRMIRRRPARNPAYRAAFVRRLPQLLATLKSRRSIREISDDLNSLLNEFGRNARSIVGTRLPSFAYHLNWYCRKCRVRNDVTIAQLSLIENLRDRQSQWEQVARALSTKTEVRRAAETTTPTRSKAPLEHLVRSGPPLDKPLTAAEFQTRLGIAGVELGNYVGKGHGERLLSVVAEALIDLQHLLGEWITTLSRRGNLSIALGARGKGKACAHYEPGLRVINLVRSHGDGSLAHEVAHLMDHMLTAYSPTGESRYLSARASNAKTDDHAIVLAMSRVMRDISWSPCRECIVGDHSPRRWFLQRWITARGYDPKQEPQESFDRVADAAPHIFRSGRNARSKSVSLVNSIAKFSQSKVEVDIACDVQSSFMENAKELGVYWRRPEELFARAFEAYVEDKLGWRSEYLVSGTQNDYSRYRGLPYPTGTERERINLAMAELIDACRRSI